MIEQIISLDKKTDKYMCRCEKTGFLTERIMVEEETGIIRKPSNTEAALCDAEIKKFVSWLKKNGHGGKCWCKFITEYINASI